MTNSPDCLFCKIKDKKLVAWIVYEDDHALALLDIQPRAPGHTMVIPKYHAETILDLPASEIGPLFTAVKNVAGLIMKNLKPDGLTIGVNQGKASGQMIDHLHVHVMPRFQDDKGGSVHGVVNNPPQASFQEMVQKITQ